MLNTTNPLSSRQLGFAIIGFNAHIVTEPLTLSHESRFQRTRTSVQFQEAHRDEMERYWRELDECRSTGLLVDLWLMSLEHGVLSDRCLCCVFSKER
jgi:hypothetical protein